MIPQIGIFDIGKDERIPIEVLRDQKITGLYIKNGNNVKYVICEYGKREERLTQEQVDEYVLETIAQIERIRGAVRDITKTLQETLPNNN